MFKKLLIFFIASFVVVAILAQAEFFSGEVPTDLGVVNGRLKAPSETKNSVSSQAEYFRKTNENVDYAKIEPLNYKGDGKQALVKLKAVIAEHFKEARLIEENENYLRYEFVSRWMRFVDDVEFYLNEKENYIHFRSAYRRAQTDLGRNRQRMEAVRKIFREIN